MVFPISIDIYNQDCIVVVNGEFKDAIPYFKKYAKWGSKNAEITVKYIEENEEKYKVEKKLDIGHGCLYTQLPKGYVMVFNHSNNWIDTTGVVVHESLHLTYCILQRAGFVLSSDSEEAFTYLQEYIVEKILKKIY